MPKTTDIVINTAPIIAIVAALGDLRVLQIYRRVWVPFEVWQEISAGGAAQFAVAEFEAAHWLQKRTSPLHLAPVLLNTLDRGEAAGRRIARLNGLSVTGSVGVLLRALNEGHRFSMREAIDRMMAQGIWLSDRVIDFALAQAGEESEAS